MWLLLSFYSRCTHTVYDHGSAAHDTWITYYSWILYFVAGVSHLIFSKLLLLLCFQIILIYCKYVEHFLLPKSPVSAQCFKCENNIHVCVTVWSGLHLLPPTAQRWETRNGNNQQSSRCTQYTITHCKGTHTLVSTNTTQVHVKSNLCLRWQYDNNGQIFSTAFVFCPSACAFKYIECSCYWPLQI